MICTRLKVYKTNILSEHTRTLCPDVHTYVAGVLLGYGQDIRKNNKKWKLTCYSLYISSIICREKFGHDWRCKQNTRFESVSKCLMRWTRNPSGSACEGSNPPALCLRNFHATLCRSCNVGKQFQCPSWQWGKSVTWAMKMQKQILPGAGFESSMSSSWERRLIH